MSEHRSPVTRIIGSSVPRRRRWLIGAVGALGASGLILGGVGTPVTADDVNAAGNLHASADVQSGCVTAAVGTGEAGASVGPQSTPDAAPLQAAGQGSATVAVCRDDPGGTPPGDPGGSVPGDLDGVVPDDLDDVAPGDLSGSLVGVVTAVLEDGLPGDGGGPGGALPDDLGDIVPDGPGGLVPDGSGIDPGALLERVAQIIPGAVGGGGPDGDGGGAPAVNTSTTGSLSGSATVNGAQVERGAPTDAVLGAEVVPGAPAFAGTDTSVSPGGTLPRTGGGLGNGVLRLVAVLGLGRAIFCLANRRRFAAGAGRG